MRCGWWVAVVGVVVILLKESMPSRLQPAEASITRWVDALASRRTFLDSTTAPLIQSRVLATLPQHSVARGGCEKCFHSLLGTVTLVTSLSRISLSVEGFPPSSSFVQHSCGVKRSSFTHPRDVRHDGLRFFYD